MLATIQDALARYSLSRYGISTGVVDFEIFCSRASTMGLLNYTDRLMSAFGRVVYALAWTDAMVPADVARSETRCISYGASEPGELVLHVPTWRRQRDRFANELLRSYEKLRVTKRSLNPLVADVRDLVCYRMRLRDADFDLFLTRLYAEAMAEDIGLVISLEADETRELAGSQTTKRNPLYLQNSAPRTMLRVYRRT